MAVETEQQFSLNKIVIGVIPVLKKSPAAAQVTRILNDKTILEWVFDGVQNSNAVNEIIVITDDPEVAKIAEDRGALVVVSDGHAEDESELIWPNVKNFEFDVLVKISATMPFVKGEWVQALVSPFLDDENVNMSLLTHPIYSLKQLASPSCVKVLMDQDGDVVYLSRFPIPFSRVKPEAAGQGSLGQQRSLSAYSREFFSQLVAAGASQMEISEDIEELRALYLGSTIKAFRISEENLTVENEEDYKRAQSAVKPL